MSTILTDDELPPMPDGTHPQSMLGQMLRKYADAREAAVLAKLREQEPVVEFMGRRRTPEGTRECWGILICDDMQDPEKGAKLYIHPAAMPSEGSSQWRDVMPGGKMTDKWESSRVADYNQGWNDYRRAALRNLESAAPQQADRQRVPDGYVLVPRVLLERASASIGSFVSDQGWGQADMDAMDGIDAMLAAAPEAPAQASAVDDDYKGWYCAHCQRGVDGREVTFREQHETCGRVITDDRPPKTQASEADERAAFEDWVLREYATVRREHGELRWDDPSAGAAVGHAWSGWQARAALAQKGGK